MAETHRVTPPAATVHCDLEAARFSAVTRLTVSPSPLLCLSTLLFQYEGFSGFSGLLGVSKIERKDGYDEQRAGRQQNRERGCIESLLVFFVLSGLVYLGSRAPFALSERQ